MNPAAVLALIGDLYAQIIELQRQLDEARTQLAATFPKETP